MDLTFAHYRNRFCMYRTYYALAKGLVKPDGFTLSVVELPDPPSHEQEEALIRGDVQVANVYLPNFLRRKLQGAPIIGIATEWKSTMKGNGIFVRADGPIKTPHDLTGRLIATHQGAHAIHRYLLKHRYGVDEKTLRWESYPQEELLAVLKRGKVDAVVLLDQFFFRGEQDKAARCLYTDGEVWNELFGFSEMIKHMIAMRFWPRRATPGSSSPSPTRNGRSPRLRWKCSSRSASFPAKFPSPLSSRREMASPAMNFSRHHPFLISR